MKSPCGIIHIPDNLSLQDFILNRLRKFQTKTALIETPSGREFTYDEIVHNVERLVSAFTRRGFRQNDVLCIFSANCIDYPIIVLAVISIGGVITTINPTSTAEEVKRQLKNSGAKYIVCGRNVVNTARQAVQELALFKEILVLGKTPGFTSIDELYLDDGPFYPKSSHKINAKTDVVLMPYSSGTTGLPKGVKLTHYNIIANILQLSHPMLTFSPNPEEDVFIVYLPLFHVYGLVILLLGGLCLGNKLVVMTSFEIESYLTNIQKYKATILHMVPPTVVQLTKYPLLSNYDLSSVQDVICGAAPLSKEVSETFMEKTMIKNVRQGYGLTETTASAVLSLIVGAKHGAAGYPLPSSEIKIMDTENQKVELGTGKEGEVWIRGPNITTGYFNAPEAENIPDENGWLHSGDIGYFDESGLLFIVDRLKELIKYKGFQVPPAELEALLLTHPSVTDVAVIGVPDVDAGECPRAFVVKKQQTVVTEKQLMDFVHDRVAPHKRLHGGVTFVDEIPKSPSGKILRRILRERIKSPLLPNDKRSKL